MIRNESDRTKIKKELIHLDFLRRRLLTFQRNIGIDVTKLVAAVEDDIQFLRDHLALFESKLLRDTKAESTTIDPFAVLRIAIELPASILEARLQLGWSQTRLAQSAGLQPSQLSRYEKNDYKNINLSHAIRLCHVLENERQDRQDCIERHKLTQASTIQASTGTGAGASGNLLSTSTPDKTEADAIADGVAMDCASD